MRFHGLVLLAVLGLTKCLLAQDESADSPPAFLPPIPANGESMPLETVTATPDLSLDVESELQQFRDEIRQFKAKYDEVAQDLKSTDSESERVSFQQRQELLDLMTRLARDGAARKVRSQLAKSAAKAKEEAAAASSLADQSNSVPEQPEPDESSLSEAEGLAIDATNPIVASEITDAFALGKVLFNRGEYGTAEKAFRKAKVTPENEMTLKYLIATCLRRQSKWRPAMEAYKVVAESDQDPVLQKLAKWQLDNIRWQQDSESQLEQLRKQREKQLDGQKSVSAGARSSTR